MGGQILIREEKGSPTVNLTTKTLFLEFTRHLSVRSLNQEIVEETGGRYSAAVLHFFFYYFGRWYLLTVSSISFLFPRSLTTAQFLIPSSLCCRLMPVRE